MGIEVRNYSSHGAAQLAWLTDEVSGHTSLVEALSFVGRVTGSAVIPDVIAQDEYSHDVTMRVRDDLYLAYAMT